MKRRLAANSSARSASVGVARREPRRTLRRRHHRLGERAVGARRPGAHDAAHAVLARERPRHPRVALDRVALVGRRVAGAGVDHRGGAAGSELGDEPGQPRGIDTQRRRRRRGRDGEVAHQLGVALEAADAHRRQLRPVGREAPRELASEGARVADPPARPRQRPEQRRAQDPVEVDDQIEAPAAQPAQEAGELAQRRRRALACAAPPPGGRAGTRSPRRPRAGPATALAAAGSTSQARCAPA